ncbi:MAG: rod shape-determining protein MreB, partial [Anaerolineae bacterium]|nr:rod shape-determining protein MreB [Anaerolineae bacterium]
RAVHEAAVAAGAHPSHVYLIPEPLAAALGAGLPVDTPTGNMVVDLGGGTTEAAVISMLGIVTAHSVRVGGIRMDEAIIAYVRRKYNMAIGEPTAEQVKIQIGTALPLDPALTMEVQGRDLVTGLPRTILLSSDEILEAIQESLQAIIGVVRAVLERTPPELAADIIDRGIALVGGGAMLRRIDEFLTQQTGVPAYVADAPMACVAIGAGKALEHVHLFQRTLTTLWSSI